jgi:CheY-like chemotaxis protein
MKKRCLLYVDDSADLAGLVKTFFEKRFPAYEVLLASSVEEALQQLHAARDSGELPHAIVADANLQARNDGVTLVEAVRAEFPRMRTILVSGAPRNGGQVPAHGFVLKEGNAMQFVDRMFDLVQCPTDQLPSLN